jgi:hypothetical protein
MKTVFPAVSGDLGSRVKEMCIAMDGILNGFTDTTINDYRGSLLFILENQTSNSAADTHYKWEWKSSFINPALTPTDARVQITCTEIRERIKRYDGNINKVNNMLNKIKFRLSKITWV